MICIFPEGKITADGEISQFKPGLMKILKRDAVAVVPMALNGLWGSLFSRKDGPIGKRRPRKFLAKITLAVAEPVSAANVDMAMLEDQVKALRTKK